MSPRSFVARSLRESPAGNVRHATWADRDRSQEIDGTQVNSGQESSPRPKLPDLLIRGLDAAVPRKRLFGSSYYEFTQVATVAGYLFEQSTLIGSLTREHPAEITQLVRADLSRAGWEHYHKDYEGAETLRAANLTRQFIAPEGVLQEAAERRPSVSVEELAVEFDLTQRELASRITPSMYLLRTEWPEVYAPGAAFIDRRRWAARMKQRWTLAEAFALWTQACAQGLDFGLFFPAKADQMLKAAFASPDATQWAQARADGLKLPPTPVDRDMTESAKTVIAAVRALAAEHYPELALVIGDAAQ